MSRHAIVIDHKNLNRVAEELAKLINVTIAVSQNQEVVTEWEAPIWDAIEFFLQHSPIVIVEQ